jgi:hypothetical protein
LGGHARHGGVPIGQIVQARHTTVNIRPIVQVRHGLHFSSSVRHSQFVAAHGGKWGCLFRVDLILTFFDWTVYGSFFVVLPFFFFIFVFRFHSHAFLVTALYMAKHTKGYK